MHPHRKAKTTGYNMISENREPPKDPETARKQENKWKRHKEGMTKEAEANTATRRHTGL